MKFKVIIIVLIFISINCVSQNIENMNKIEIVNSFILELLKNDFTKLDKYLIEIRDSKFKDDILILRNKQLKKLYSTIKNKHYKIISYDNYKSNKLKFVSEKNSNNVIIVEVSGIKNIYFKLKNNKIESFSPLTKGEIIIGWS